jgi:hypothetical protein
MQRRTVLATVVAGCALVAATPGGALAAAKKPKSIGTWQATTASAKTQANTAATDTALAEVKKQVADLSAAVAALQGQSGGVNLVLAAAPQIIDGLTQLQNGLTTLAAAYQSVEYGVAQVNVGGGGTLVSMPVWSADIPDDGNGTTATGSGTFIYGGTGRDVTITLNAYIRSNEANIDGSTGPVGQAGGQITVRNSSGAFVPCSNYAAQTGGVAITLPGEPINTPTGPVKNVPFMNIPSAKPRTDQTVPGGDAPQLTSCSFTVPAGGPYYYTVGFTATFLDIPTTLTPGPRD